jgi:hypothetical protein
MKKIFLVLVLAMAVAGVGFAQDNTITVDFGPTLVGLSWSKMGELMGGGGESGGVSTTGFGIAAQYERQLTEEVSLGGRFTYLGCSIGMGDNYAAYTVSLTSFAIEAHARYYPTDIFFLDGMLGYANLAVGFNGKMDIAGEDESPNVINVGFSVPRNYLKLGAKIGWRVDFGDPGGFVFEPSIGWCFGVGISPTLGEGLSKEVGADMTDLNTYFYYFENWVFIGGPRATLSFGWRF